MKHYLFIITFLLSELGVSLWAQTGTTLTDSILSGGIQRKFRLYKPNSYNGNTAVPLVLNLHGYTSNATQQQFYGNFMPIADTANFLIVHPEGTAPLGSQFWNAGIAGSPNDIAFLNALIDSLMLQYNIDPNAVYSCGMSNGGIMSYYMACLSNSKIAAIASVTGTMFNTWLNVIPGRIVPVMEIHGTADNTVPYTGSTTNNMAPIDTVLKRWRTHNACNSTSLITNVTNTNTTDGATAINYKFYNANGKAYVEHYKVNNATHTWPGAAINLGVTCMDFNASVEIWRFFRQFKLNQLQITNLPENEKQKNTTLIFPNPSSDYLYINLPVSSLKEIRICNLEGKIVQRSNTSVIDIRHLENGIYLMSIQTVNGSFNQKIVKTPSH